MSCTGCQERNAENGDDCDYCSCGCHGCDCCGLCLGAPVGDYPDKVEASCCGSFPEYNCPGECRHRGEPGHYQVKPAGDPHPTLTWPERICSQPCCRPAEVLGQAERGLL